MQANRKPVACKNLNVRNIDGETVILNRATDQIHTLNSTASLIWDMIEKQSDIDAIIEKLTDSYSINADVAASDLNLILQEFAKLELIESDITV